MALTMCLMSHKQSVIIQDVSYALHCDENSYRPLSHGGLLEAVVLEINGESSSQRADDLKEKL